MITKLADKWRAENRQSGWSYESDKADELEAALPKWTQAQIGESSTFPDRGEAVVIYFAGSIESGSHPFGITVKAGDWWRPLCDIDYPPEQES